MKLVFLDMKEIREKEALHLKLQEKLTLPDYYGKNLDALHDVLTEGKPALFLIFENCSRADDGMQSYLEQVKTLCGDIADSNPLFLYKFYP